MPALSGMRVLDLTLYEAGPSCTQALAWLGAEVVKVEKPEQGDPGRYVGTGKPDSPYFLYWNSNKRSITVDLSTEDGRELLRRLVPHYDVFVENYGPGVVEKLGLDAERLRALYPSLIYASVKGFGSSGPYASYKCFDMVAQSAAGAFSVTGEPDGPPMRPGPTMGDAGTGVQLALAITAAYAHRLKTGEGQTIELSMQEAMTYYMRTMIALGTGFGKEATPRTGTGMGPDINLYPCEPGGPNDYVYIVVATPRMWQALCKAIDHPELADDPRFASKEARDANADALAAMIAAWTRGRDKHEAMRVLAEGGVPCSAVLDTADLLQDRHLRARGFVQSVEHPSWGEVELLGCPARLSGGTEPLRAAPVLGEATAEILGRDLEISAEELDALVAAGTIGKPASR